MAGGGGDGGGDGGWDGGGDGGGSGDGGGVAAPSQLRLPQHGMDDEDSGPLQEIRVRDSALPSQLQYSLEEAEMKVIQLPGLDQV
ncbi:unnamed protein product [Schistocephalus solidus]|uniref:E2F transcription factor 6 n=1 Tax=Schistocephalus solidus TaxID=70667 RepID=A0A183TGE6_SCHSO|nr:unnamed protein product [Schistocephalus solidus]